MKYMEVKHLLYCSTDYMSLTHSAILVINKLRVFFMNYVKMDILFDDLEITKIDILQNVSDPKVPHL